MVQFKLVPFSPNPWITTFEGEIELSSHHIKVIYQLEGDLEQYQWTDPTSTTHPQDLRKDNLWQSTCLELFIASHAKKRYCEFNLSPSGHWQSYQFSDYRQGQESSIDLNLGSVEQTRNQNKAVFHASIEYPLAQNVTKFFEIGICAILLDKNDQYHYYALQHHGDKPDFHLRSSFVLSLTI